MSKGKRKKQGKRVHVNDYASFSRAPKDPSQIKLSVPGSSGEGFSGILLGTQFSSLRKKQSGQVKEPDYEEQAAQAQLDRAYGKRKAPTLFGPGSRPPSRLEQTALDANWGAYGGVVYCNNTIQGGLTVEEVMEVGFQVKDAIELSKQRSQEQHIPVRYRGRRVYIEITAFGGIRWPMLRDATPILGTGANRGYGKTDDVREIADYKPEITQTRRGF